MLKLFFSGVQSGELLEFAMDKTEHLKGEVKKTANGKNLKETVNDELERIGSGGPWVWYENKSDNFLLFFIIIGFYFLFCFYLHFCMRKYNKKKNTLRSVTAYDSVVWPFSVAVYTSVRITRANFSVFIYNFMQVTQIKHATVTLSM